MGGGVGEEVLVYVSGECGMWVVVVVVLFEDDFVFGDGGDEGVGVGVDWVCVEFFGVGFDYGFWYDFDDVELIVDE